MLEISWNDRVRNEEVLHRIKEKRNILRRIKKGRVNGLFTSYAEIAFQNTLLKER
jgi:hypothetical protein